MRQGRGEEGTRLLHEAMAASLAGESRRPHTVVYTSCNLISACAQTAELDHARQWIRAADDFERRYGNPHLYTTCRTYLGAILFASGDWVDAERELRAALDIGASAEPAVCAEAAGQLAELRLAQGRLEEAERMLEGFENFETSSVVARPGACCLLGGGCPVGAAGKCVRGPGVGRGGSASVGAGRGDRLCPTADTSAPGSRTSAS